MAYKVAIADYYYPNLEQEKRILSEIDVEIIDCNGKCNTEEDTIKHVKDANAIITQFVPITERVIQELNNCKIIVRYAIGLDIIDIEAASKKGIMVSNIPDYCVEEVATHALSLIMAVVRKIYPIANDVREGNWSYKPVTPLYRLSKMSLGIIGFGKIARKLAEIVSSFNFEQIYVFDPYYKGGKLNKNINFVSFKELLNKSDIVSVHAPANDETKNMFNKDTFNQMKDGSFLINTSRGALINERDLVEAIKNGKIAGVGLDVLEGEEITIDHPLLEFDNVLITPHMGWYSVDSIAELQRKVAEQVKNALLGQEVDYCVNKF